MKVFDALAVTAVGAATLALLPVIPELPFAHLDDPSHWGVLGYFVTVAAIAALRLRGIRGSRTETRLLALFLAGMPLIYVANWLRFGGSGGWLGIELVGAVLFGGLAWLGLRRWPWLLAVGIAAHGLWDLAHFERTAFVPDWYTIACALIDFAAGVYATAQIRDRGDM